MPGMNRWAKFALLRCSFLLLLLLIGLSNSVGSLVDKSILPLSTSGNKIVGTDGSRVKWACVNWYGPNLHDTNVVGGLSYQPLDVLVSQIVDMGFNCIRLPFTVEQALNDPEVPTNSALPKEVLAANPELLALSSLEVMDATVEALTEAGLMVIMNVHTSASEWCCQLTSHEGLWFTPEWTLSQFEQSLVEITERYKDNKLVVGMDLRNEIHDVNAPGEEPVPVGWGRGDPDLDWSKVAERTGKLVQSSNPSILIIVTALCFAMDLRGCKSTGVIPLTYPNKLVWTVHSYRFFTPYFDIPNMMGLKGYRELLFVSGGIFVITLGGAVSLRRSNLSTKSLNYYSLLTTFVTVMFLASVSSYVAASTMKDVCNTWYHADVKFVPGGMFALTVLVPVGVYVRGKIRAGGGKDGEEGMVELVSVGGGGRGETETEDEEKFEGTCLLTRLVVLKALTCLQFFVVISFVSIVWSMVATSPKVYANFNDRMWGFAGEEGKAYTAPIWMSEFGADTRDAYWVGVMEYLKRSDMDWAYWAYYGSTRYEKSREVDIEVGDYVNSTFKESYGLMNEDYSKSQFATGEGLYEGDWRVEDMRWVMEIGGLNGNGDYDGWDLEAVDGVW